MMFCPNPLPVLPHRGKGLREGGKSYSSFYNRQHNAPCRPSADFTLNRQRAPMLTDDPLTDSQTQPCPFAFRFGGEKGIHYFRQILRGDAYARINDLDNDMARRARNAYGQGSALRHGVAGIGEQVQKQLSQLLAVASNHRHVGCELLYHGYLKFAKMIMNQFQRFLYLVAYVYCGDLR